MGDADLPLHDPSAALEAAAQDALLQEIAVQIGRTMGKRSRLRVTVSTRRTV
jgi:hypothetical protein